MYCPECRSYCGDYDHFCSKCGCPTDKPVPKGSHRVPMFILLLLSAFGIFIFFFTSAAHAAPDIPWFRSDGGRLHFESTLYDGPSEVLVPEEIDGIAITEISPFCFAFCDDISTVILPETLTVIGNGAFRQCTSLRGIFIPEGVKAIGNSSFSECHRLEAISVPESVIQIQDNVFSGCTGLNHIFYSGTYEQWLELNVLILDSAPEIHCSDGTF